MNQTKLEITFEEFSSKLDGMNERCGICRFLEYREEESFCTKHNIERSNKDPRCDDWRYFA